MMNPIPPIRILPADSGMGADAAPAGGKFLDTLQRSIAQAGTQLQGAQGEAAAEVADVLNGKGADLHSAMIAVEKADLSFQLMMQVRNKIVQAYQQISGMQF